MPLKRVKAGLSDEEMGFGATALPVESNGLSDEDMGFKKNPSDLRAAAVREVRPKNVQSDLPDYEPGLKLGGLGDTTFRSGAAKILGLLGGSPDAVKANVGDVVTLGNDQYSPRAKADLSTYRKQFPVSSGIGTGIGMAGLVAAQNAVPAARVLGVNLSPIASQGVQGFLEKPSDNAPSDLAARLHRAKTNAETAGALELAGPLSAKLGDYIMQKAVGAKDYVKGLGSRMVDEGLVGTKGMMKGQVAKAMPGAISETNAAAAATPGQFTPYESAKGISDLIKRKLPPSGVPLSSTPENAEAAQAASNRLLAIVGRPNLSAADQLALARKVGAEAYREGEPLAGLKNELNRIDAGAMKSTLKNASEGIRSGLGREETLQTAKNALNDPYTLAELGRTLAKTGAAGGLAGAFGAAHGGADEAKADAALATLATALGSTSLAKSVLAQGLVRGGKNSAAISALINEKMARKAREK